MGNTPMKLSQVMTDQADAKRADYLSMKGTECGVMFQVKVE